MSCNNEDDNSEFYDTNIEPFENKLISVNKNEWISIVKSSDLEEWTQTWKYNRDINIDKVKEIVEIYKSKKFMDSLLYFFYNKNKNKYICIDGCHRLNALILLAKTTNTNIKVLCYIYNNFTKKEIVDKFNDINKSTPIPELYFEYANTKDECVKDKCQIIAKVFNEYKIKYNAFYSLSQSPNRPNFNETMFYNLCNSFNDNTLCDYELLKNELQQLNIKNKNISKNNSKILSKKQLEKCEKESFFLFAVNIRF